MQYRPNRQQETFSELNKPIKLLTILCDVTHTCLCPLCPAVQSSPEITNILNTGFFAAHHQKLSLEFTSTESTHLTGLIQVQLSKRLWYCKL